jgi:phosphatidylglycerophosphate synthase
MERAIHIFAREASPARSAANAVTAVRAAVAALLLGMAAAFAAPGPGPRWVLTCLAIAAFLGDGLDGYLARRTGSASDFGARFDMETDAFFILALALLVHTWGQAGAFVLLSGALRYLFVVAGWIVPALAAPLAPSFRRKAVCAAQTAVLVASLAPIVPATVAQCLCTAGLALLVASFAIDCARLLATAR